MSNLEIRLVNSVLVNSAKYGIHNVPAPVANTIMPTNEANNFIDSLHPKGVFTLPNSAYTERFSLVCPPIKVFSLENNRLKRVELVVKTVGPEKISGLRGKRMRRQPTEY